MNFFVSPKISENWGIIYKNTIFFTPFILFDTLVNTTKQKWLITEHTQKLHTGNRESLSQLLITRFDQFYFSESAVL